MPKPTDAMGPWEGSLQDTALRAWSKVEKAVQRVGIYSDVVFDDPWIHRVIYDMGGWIRLGTQSLKKWRCVAKEFEKRYKSYRARKHIPEYPAVMVGIMGFNNRRDGYAIPPPYLVGHQATALQVMRAGQDKALLAVTRRHAWEHAETSSQLPSPQERKKAAYGAALPSAPTLQAVSEVLPTAVGEMLGQGAQTHACPDSDEKSPQDSGSS